MLRALIMLLSNFSVGALSSWGIMTAGTIEVGSWAIRVEPYRACSNQDAFCDPFESARGEYLTSSSVVIVVRIL